ncbi:sensor histidine kinase [Paramicrobacterium chengjingii]|uniref:histidine kinase n=1 Tax=Paramicrobacterium chengjingii TaxID=2769067 RepID=A0ABX6YJ57_9MICO|nr:HAMP domain-containing sensor histidine kinase [Microbacterium chengjingii]QPZ38750.1 HAMP domain-containing histidine kinase [Microbacterium chengjingii]
MPKKSHKDRSARDPLRVSLLAAVGIDVLVVFLVSLSFAVGGAVLSLSAPLAALFAITFSSLSALSGLMLIVRRRRIDLATNAHLRQLEARRADQVSMLSHEVRTPLAVIHGSVELLAEERPGTLTPGQRRFVRRIAENTERMSHLAEQLLTQSRIEAGVFEVKPTTIDMRALLREVVGDLAHVADVPIVLDAPGAPVRAHGDPELIRQVVTNLIMNAARSDPHHSSVEVRVTSGDGYAMVSVSDGGTGMSAAQRDRLFQRFSSGRPLGNGTGIGLFISQQVIELHGGRIFVDTITGRGTTMMFTLPIKE